MFCINNLVKSQKHSNTRRIIIFKNWYSLILKKSQAIHQSTKREKYIQNFITQIQYIINSASYYIFPYVCMHIFCMDG